MLARVLGAFILAVLAGACATHVESDITAFHSLPAAPVGKTFVMVPYEKQEGSLEWQTYANMVATKLQQKGLTLVQLPTTPDYAVFIAYAIDGGRTTVSAAPMYGQTGGGTTTTTTGYVGRTPIYGTSYTPPTYGVTGYVPVQSTVYGRAVKISILDAKKALANDKSALVYEGTATSAGSSGNLNVVMPAIINSMFIDWPGPSGKTQRREVPLGEQ